MFKVFDRRQLSHSPAVEFHDGAWISHSESLSRALQVVSAIDVAAPAQDFGLAPIERVHSAEYVEFLAGAHDRWRNEGRQGDAIGFTWANGDGHSHHLQRIDGLIGRYTSDVITPIGPGTWEAAYWSAQTALTALQPLLAGESKSAFALCRPPGHHAGRDRSAGYCYINNVAVAAQSAIDARNGPVAILDVDYHHGDGTQSIFYDRGDVFFASIHADPAADYPFYAGYAGERGEGAGSGATLNLPLPRGTALSTYLPALAQAMEAIDRFGARTLCVSFGADTFVGDPIGHFHLETSDFEVIAQKIAALDLPTLVVMEGGYAIERLGTNVAAFLGGFS